MQIFQSTLIFVLFTLIIGIIINRAFNKESINKYTNKIHSKSNSDCFREEITDKKTYSADPHNQHAFDYVMIALSENNTTPQWPKTDDFYNIVRNRSEFSDVWACYEFKNSKFADLQFDRTIKNPLTYHNQSHFINRAFIPKKYRKIVGIRKRIENCFEFNNNDICLEDDSDFDTLKKHIIHVTGLDLFDIHKGPKYYQIIFYTYLFTSECLELIYFINLSDQSVDWEIHKVCLSNALKIVLFLSCKEALTDSHTEEIYHRYFLQTLENYFAQKYSLKMTKKYIMTRFLLMLNYEGFFFDISSDYDFFHSDQNLLGTKYLGPIKEILKFKISLLKRSLLSQVQQFIPVIVTQTKTEDEYIAYDAIIMDNFGLSSLLKFHKNYASVAAKEGSTYISKSILQKLTLDEKKFTSKIEIEQSSFIEVFNNHYNHMNTIRNELYNMRCKFANSDSHMFVKLSAIYRFFLQNGGFRFEKSTEAVKVILSEFFNATKSLKSHNYTEKTSKNKLFRSAIIKEILNDQIQTMIKTPLDHHELSSYCNFVQKSLSFGGLKHSGNIFIQSLIEFRNDLRNFCNYDTKSFDKDMYDIICDE